MVIIKYYKNYINDQKMKMALYKRLQVNVMTLYTSSTVQTNIKTLANIKLMNTISTTSISIIITNILCSIQLTNITLITTLRTFSRSCISSKLKYSQKLI